MDSFCRPAVNAIECSGCGGCVDMFPHVFGWDDLAERPTIKDGLFPCEDIRQAAALCPRDCIEAVDEEQTTRRLAVSSPARRPDA